LTTYHDEFANYRKTLNAVIRNIEAIGETTKNISDKIKAENKDLPWKRMACMIDKLIRGYFGIDTKPSIKRSKKTYPAETSNPKKSWNEKNNKA
jgi:uncharacterized protein with HEPN domain